MKVKEKIKEYIKCINISQIDKRAKIVSGILAIIFAFIQIVGCSVNNSYSLDGIIGSKKLILKNIVQLIGYAIIFYLILVFLFTKVFEKLKNKETKECKYFTNNTKSFLICTIIIIIAYIPYFLHHYPGIFTTDSISEMYSAIGGMENLVNHHPVFHIWIVYLCLNLGKILGNYTIGIAIYSILQMILTASVFSYTIKYMAKKNVNIYIRALTLIVFALYPPFAAYSITMWKDVPFALMMLLFVIQMVEVVTNPEYFKSVKNIVGFTILAILVVLFRNNGIYVIAITMLILLAALKNSRKNVAITTAIILGFYLLLKGPIFTFFNITDGPVREALSVPLQQIARTVKYRENELTKEEKETIYKYLPVENLGEKYYPIISDNVKDNFNNEEFKENKTEFISIWAKLLIKYPKEYVEAFLSNSFGYWYPNAMNWVIATWYDYPKDDIIQYERQPLVEIKLIDYIESIVNQRKIPVLSMTLSIGFIFEILLVLIGYIIYKKKYKAILMYVPILALWLTTIASPVWCEYRYIYSMFTCFPLLACMGIILANKKED